MNSGFEADAGFILGMVFIYLSVGFFIQRAMGKEQCEGEGLCHYDDPHPGVSGHHSRIGLIRRIAIMIGWSFLAIFRIIRFVLQALGWTISRFHPQRTWNGLCAVGRTIRWTVQGT